MPQDTDKIVSVPPIQASAETPEQEYILIFTPLFYEKQSLARAVQLGTASFPEFSADRLAKAWMWAEMERGKSARVSKTNTNLSNTLRVKRSVAMSREITALSLAEMLNIEAVKSGSGKQGWRPTNENFTAWWTNYPARNTNGTPTRGHKGEALQLFMASIISENLLHSLLYATEKYRQSCGDYAMDAKRFLRAGNWKSYLD